MLNEYLKSLQGFVRDRQQRLFEPADLVGHINRARREIAFRSQCIRVVPPISGSVIAVQVTNPGGGYTNPTIVITPPDLPDGGKLYPSGAQATAIAIVLGGQIASISVPFGGFGYALPTVQITDPTGSGATAVAIVSPIAKFNANQEEYHFTELPLDTFPGVKSVFATLNHWILFNNLRYRIAQYSLTDYKSLIEVYPFQYSFVPAACAQKEQGTSGSFLFFPIPSQQYPWEADCLCLPEDLLDDQSYEAIPEPWIEGVPYLAAQYAMEEIQSYNNAKYWGERFKEAALRHSIYARPRMLSNIYGRI